MPEMTAPQLAYYLARIQDATSPPKLRDIAEDDQREHPTDEATPRIVAMVAARSERLVELACQADVGVSQTRRLTRVRSAQR